MNVDELRQLLDAANAVSGNLPVYVLGSFSIGPAIPGLNIAGEYADHVQVITERGQTHV